MRHSARRPLVRPALEGAGEAHHRRFACIRARKPERQMRRLGSGRRKAHTLGRRHEALHELRPLDLKLMRSAEVRSELRLALERLDERRMRVAEKEGAM